jgi:hypothetical protein
MVVGAQTANYTAVSGEADRMASFADTAYVVRAELDVTPAISWPAACREHHQAAKLSERRYGSGLSNGVVKLDDSGSRPFDFSQTSTRSSRRTLTALLRGLTSRKRAIAASCRSVRYGMPLKLIRLGRV